MRNCRTVIAFLLLMMTPLGHALALDERVLQRLAETYVSGVFTLRVSVHEPNPRVTSMQAPTVWPGGWRHHNPGGPILFRSGSLVEVSEIFNYSARGFFLELAEVTEAGETSPERKRLRIRFMIEAGITSLEEQEEQAEQLIGKVLRPAAP